MLYFIQFYISNLYSYFFFEMYNSKDLFHIIHSSSISHSMLFYYNYLCLNVYNSSVLTCKQSRKRSPSSAKAASKEDEGYVNTDDEKEDESHVNND